MNSDQMEGKWKQVKGAAKEKWGKLTDDDLDVIAGKSDQLEGKIQERYGITKEEAAKQIRDWDDASLRDTDASSQRRVG
jgi:uncharacterized protein YjbJ (UPF0337 family)